jgi:hypothetical protein
MTLPVAPQPNDIDLFLILLGHYLRKLMTMKRLELEEINATVINRNLCCIVRK